MTSMEPSFQIESPSAAVAAILILLAAPRPWDLPATSKQLRKLLKAMQHSLQQNRTSASSDSRLVPCLQSLLHFGWDAEENEDQLVQKSSQPSPASPFKKYIPPAARKQQQQQNNFFTHAPSSDSEGASDAENGGIGTDVKLSRVRFLALACLQLLIKSDAKAMHPLWPSMLPETDTDLSSKAVATSKSRMGLNPLTLAHSLLLDSSARVRHSAAVTLSTLLEGPAQRAYLAVAELRPPHAGSGAGGGGGGNNSSSSTTPSAISQQTVLRGYVPLSATLGSLVVGTHDALLRALSSEQDSTVVVAILRALGTALVGTPYSRLPPHLLPQCVDTIRHVLQRAQHAQHGPQNSNLMPPALHFSVPILVGSLACLAAALGVKSPLPSLRDYLSNENGFDLAQEIFSCTTQYNTYPAVQLEALMALRGLSQQYHETVRHLWPEVLEFASSSVQTAISCGGGGDIRGGAVIDGPLSTNSTSVNVTSSSGVLLEGGSGSSPREKVIQQSILLLGDFLRHTSSPTTNTNADTDNSGGSSNGELDREDFFKYIEQKWSDAIEMCITPVIAQQESPVLQAAGFGAISNGLGGLLVNTTTKIPTAAASRESEGAGSAGQGVVVFLSREMRADLLSKCSKVLQNNDNNTSGNTSNDSLKKEEGVEGGGAGMAMAVVTVASSPVRAAAAKAMASLVSATPLSQGPSSFLDALPSLVAACQDSVVAVRVQAAAALAAAAETLLSFLQYVDQMKIEQQEDLLLLSKDAVYTFLPVAVAAAGDGDKVKPSGVQALGSLLACRLILLTSTHTTNKDDGKSIGGEASSLFLESTEQDAFVACVSSENAKVQWSACSAAGTLLETVKFSRHRNITRDGGVDSSGNVAVWAAMIVEALQQVASESSNSRSRTLALAALGALSSTLT